jgi:hypothetical protein
MRNYNFTINNFIIKSSKWEEGDVELIFGDEDFEVVDINTIQDLCILTKAYKSFGECRRTGRWGDIPKGYSEIKLSKKIRAYIWNPDKGSDCYNDD